MDLSTRFFNDAFRDLRRAMAAFEDPFFHVGPSNTVFGSSRGITSGEDQNTMMSPFTTSAGNRLGQHGGLLRYPATNVDETSDTYQISAELPGYDKKDIKIEVGDDERTIILSGSVDHQYEDTSDIPIQDSSAAVADSDNIQQQVMKKDKAGHVQKHNKRGQHWWVNERVSGAFTRSIQFPTPIDTTDIKATYQDGVLKVTVPKAKDKKYSRQIDID